MSFVDKLAADLDALAKAQRERAWSLVTGIIAALYAVAIAMWVGSDVFQPLSVESIVAVLWVGGAACGAAALLVFGAPTQLSERAGRVARAGLWIGNLTVSITIAAFPLVFPLAYVPVIGGFVVLRRFGAKAAVVYLALPFLAVGGVALNWALRASVGAS